MSSGGQKRIPGGYGIYIMVANGPLKEWIDGNDKAPGSVFTAAMKRAAGKGLIPKKALIKAITTYYLRTEEEVQFAAREVPDLEVVSVKTTVVPLCEGSGPQQMCNLAWSINQASIQTSAGLTDDEAEAVKAELKDVLEERFGQTRGANMSYIMICVRKKKP